MRYIAKPLIHNPTAWIVIDTRTGQQIGTMPLEKTIAKGRAAILNDLERCAPLRAKTDPNGD